MRNALLSILLAVLAPGLARAQGVTAPARPQEDLLVSRSVGGVLAVAAYNGVVLPSRGFAVSRITARCNAAAVGAGTFVFRVTDGTLNCDCSASCTATGQTGFGDAGNKEIECSGSCLFAARANLMFQVLTAGCATTQPNVATLDVRGFWR